MKHTKKTLGRGLDSLLDAEVIGSSSISEVAISDIYPNPDQPRRTFEEESLKELAASLRSIGLVQPITLLKKSAGDYMIISGERRWRAARMAGMTTLPAYIKTEEDEHVMEMALIENTLAYQKLIETYDLTQEELSTRVGKKRTTISNYLRLLKLPGEIQIGLTQKKIDMGHARALLSIPDPEHQLALYAEIIRQGLSVRAVESLAAHYREEGADSPAKQKKTKQSLPEEYRLLTGQLSRFFRTKVKLDCDAKGKGKLTIPFASEEELERIMALLERIR